MLKKMLAALPFLLLSLHAENIPYTRTERGPVPVPVRQRIAPRTLMYSEIQYKYGLFQNFLDGYIDRPLFFDRTIRGKTNFIALTEESFLRDCLIRQSYGFDGGGSLASAGKLSKNYVRALAYIAEFPELKGYKEFPQFAFGESGKYTVGSENARYVLKAALASPFSPKINGRIPISTYNSGRIALPAMEKFLTDLKKEFGDTFVVFGGLMIDHDDENTFYKNGQWDNALRAKYQQRIADILRVFGAIQLRPGSRRLTAEYTQITDFRLWDNEIAPLLRAELTKPENKDKLVCGNILHGYINHMSGVNLTEDGTGLARESFNRLIEFNPDMIFFFEWNEFNENTCWQPTLYNSLVLQRLVRYYAGVLRNEKPTPNRGDDLNVPPMSFSCRETLKLGEVLGLELLNIPDGSEGAYLAKLELLDRKGKVLIAFPEEKFDRSKLRAVTFRIPTEKLSREFVLLPRLSVTGADGKKLVYENLQYVRLLPTFCYNYKSVRQSLRDLLTPKSFAFTAKMNGNGIMHVAGKIDAGEKLASLEVVDFGREVYAVDPRKEFDTEKYFTFTGAFSTWRSSARPILIEVPGGGAWKIREWGFPNVTLGKFTREGDRMESRSLIWIALSRFMLSIPKENVGKAQIKVTVDGETFTFPAEKILKYGMMAHAFPKCRLLLQDERNLPDIPFPLGTDSSGFSAELRPERTYPVYQMRAVTASGKIFRSAPVIPRPVPEKFEDLSLHSEMYDQVVSVPVHSALIPRLDWKFEPACGDVMPLNGFDPFFVCELGGGYEYGGGMHTLPVPEGRHAPRWVKEDGREVLDFDGKTYLHFPKETFPRGSFTLRFEVKPDPLPETKFYTLFRHYDRILGSVTVFAKYDRLDFSFGDRKLETSSFSTGLPLEPGKWNKVEIRYDLRQLVFTVNGVEKRFDFPKHLALYFKPSLFGGHTKPEFGLPEGAEMFRGKLAGFSIEHTAESGKK